jgi:hypothetical protein
MNVFSYSEIRLIIAKSTSSNNIFLPYLKSGGIKPKLFPQRISLIKTIKTYIKKYCHNSDKYNVLYLSILYLDIILSKNKISLSHDKNLKYLCLCCFLLSLKLIGTYDTSRKIISNFCRNYKQEYKFFEAQCLMLLEHNLVYTTTYDYLNMILIKEPRKIVSICNSLLYQICEESIYTCYSPFYISIAIIQLAKNSINDKSHNHYDKYFQDENVKTLIKKLKNVVNIPSITTAGISEKKMKVDDINSLNSTINNTINNTNINIITNNNIQNNIIIINTIQNKKSGNDFIKNNSILINNRRTPVKFNIKDFTNIKNLKVGRDYLSNDIAKYRNEDYGIKSDKKDNDLIKSDLTLCRNNEINNKYHNHKTITIKQTNKKRPKCKITSLNNSNYLSNDSIPVYNYEKKNLNNRTLRKNRINKEESVSTDIQTPNDLKCNFKDTKRKPIFSNKSTLNLQLVSGISKEKLVKLSKNISKSMAKEKK